MLMYHHRQGKNLRCKSFFAIEEFFGNPEDIL